MPFYEYRCQGCRKRVSIYQSYDDYGREPVHCPHCGGENLARLLTRVRIARSDESRLDTIADLDAWGDIEESDPRTMARMMRRMGREMGEEIPPEFDDVVDRLEAGESPEEIERSLPDLGSGEDTQDI
jgi:putative FmdB family regulatory protein